MGMNEGGTVAGETDVFARLRMPDIPGWSRADSSEDVTPIL
jgi:hypothetical protein